MASTASSGGGTSSTGTVISDFTKVDSEPDSLEQGSFPSPCAQACAINCTCLCARSGGGAWFEANSWMQVKETNCQHTLPT